MTINQKRVMRLMRQLGIQGRIKRRYITTPTADTTNPFTPISSKINSFMVSTRSSVVIITFICIFIGFVYLAVIIDIYSRRIADYAIGKILSPELALAALKIALAKKGGDVSMAE